MIEKPSDSFAYIISPTLYKLIPVPPLVIGITPNTDDILDHLGKLLITLSI